MVDEVLPILITGGNGRIGGFLRGAWPWAMRGGLRPVWQARRAAAGCVLWDILNAECPPGLARGIVIGLAGRTDPADEVPLALRTLQVAADHGARHVFLASSAAVYGPGEHLREEAAPAPVSAYGRAKAGMEAAALGWHARHGAGGPALTLLRIGNVVGAGTLIGRARGPVQIHAGPDGRGPMRSWIGPMTLGAVLARLAVMGAARTTLPRVLNVAAPRPLPVADLLDAAGIPWSLGPTDPPSLPYVTLDTAQLRAIQRLPAPALQPRAMVAEWRMLEPQP